MKSKARNRLKIARAQLKLRTTGEVSTFRKLLFEAAFLLIGISNRTESQLFDRTSGDISTSSRKRLQVLGSLSTTNLAGSSTTYIHFVFYSLFSI